MEAVTPALVAVAGVAAFAIVIVRTGLIVVARTLMETVSSGVVAMLDSGLDDEAKEQAVRSAGLSLLAGAWKVAVRFSLALAAVAVPILLADLAGLVPRADSFAVLVRLDFILLTSVLAILAVWAASRRKTAAAGRITGSSAYGAGGKMVHALAFSGPGTLRNLARLDDRLFARRITAVPETQPIFITSLARGGTTALLNAMHSLPQVATHRYSDMPFISAPLLWSKCAGIRKPMPERERAHGDGMTIGLHSPEAFDEIFWRLHWPEKYRGPQISLWREADYKPEAQEFFTRHFRKIIALRHPQCEETEVRYLSKNNANIARLGLLPSMFTGCGIIVALRQPAAHAASLHRQHQNFSRLHAEDAFVQRYMRDIGHLEFGALHQPIAFDPEGLAAYQPDNPNYWLAYWISAFGNVSRHAGGMLIVTQADMRASPNTTMRVLMERLGMSGGLERDFSAFFLSSPDPQPVELFDPKLLRRAQEIYDHLAECAIRCTSPRKPDSYGSRE